MFSTGNIPSKITNINLSLNPYSTIGVVATPLPLTTSLGASIWSVTTLGAAPLPVLPLTSKQQLNVTINQPGQLYAFGPEALGSVGAITLNPNTAYGLELSGLTSIRTNDQPKWGYTARIEPGLNPTIPIGLNGFTYLGFAITSNDGTICTVYELFNACGLATNAIIIEVELLGITPGTTTNASNPASTLLSGGTVLVNEPETFPTNYTLAPLGGTIDVNGLISTFSGVFSGVGPLTIANTSTGGSTNLTGVSTYTGATVVSSGAKLSVNGSIASSSGLTVNSGGTIGGNGQLPATTIASGGVMAPGNSIGTLTVNGNYGLNGGTLAIELQGPQNDQIVVTGNVAPFTGTAAFSSYGGGTAWPGLTYSVLTANASAPFATSTSLRLDQSQITPSALLQLGTTLIQEADGNPRTFDVQWRPNNGTGAATSAMQALGADNGNTRPAATLFDGAFNRLAAASAGNTNAAGAAIGTTGFTANQATAAGLSTGFVNRMAALLAIPDGTQLQQALGSVTPQSYAAFQSVSLNALRLQRETINSQAGNCQQTGWLINGSTGGNDKKVASTSQAKVPLCAFATGGNSTSTINSSRGLSGYDSTIAGGFFGLEMQPTSQWTVGVAYGYGTAVLGNLGASANTVSSTLNSISLYGVYKPDPGWSIKTLLGYSNTIINGQRNLIAIGNGTPISGSTTGNGYTAAVLADYSIPLTKPAARVSVALNPQLGVAYGSYQQNGFQETGDPSMNLNVASHTSQSLLGSIGAELVAAIPLNSANSQLFKPRLAVAYQVDALANSRGNTSIDATLPAAGANLTTSSLGRGVNDITVSGTLEYVIAPKASLYATASYEAFTTGNQFAYGGGVKISF